MPLPIILALVYLAVNIALMVWLERERARGRRPTDRVSALSFVLRFVPPLLGLAYLVTLAGDWLFVLFVIAFFAIGFWLMDGLLAVTSPRGGSEAMRSGWDDRGRGAHSATDRDRG